MRDSRFWMRQWESDEYLQQKRASLREMLRAITKAPRRVLDIGAGLAYEAQWLQHRYGCELCLLDGDIRYSAGRRDTGFGTAEDFRFYQPLSSLRKAWDKRGLRYEFVDAAYPQLSGVFDLVYSSLSCGFHYPLDVYVPLISRHITDDSVVVFDIRRRYISKAQKVVRIVEILSEDEKKYKCSVKIKPPR